MTRAQLVKALQYSKFVAILRELASLDLTQGECVRLLNTSSSRVSQTKHREGIPFKAYPKAYPKADTPLVAAIRAGYAVGKGPRQLAFELHTSSGTIRTMASREGIKMVDPGSTRRGFQLPADKLAAYHELRELKLTRVEAGMELGVIPRGVGR